MSKLSWHFQRRPSQIVDIVNGTNCRWVKMIDPPEGSNPFPNKKIVGRIWIGGDGVEGEYVRQGAEGASAYLQHEKDGVRLIDYIRRRPYVDVWEGPNEPHPLSEQPFRALLNDFEIQRTVYMHNIDKSVDVGGFSVGWLNDPEQILEFEELCELADFWHLHEYSAPRMWDAEGWHCLRYRKMYEVLAEHGIRQPPLLITECGIDGGAHHIEELKRAETGWRTYVGDEHRYIEDLTWYDERICEDDYVEAAFVFTAGPEPKWHDFELTPDMSRMMQRYINAHPHEEEPPVAEDPEYNALQEQIRAEATSRLWPPGPIHYTPMWALWREARIRGLGGPRTLEFDIAYGGTMYRCQAFALGILYTEVGHWGANEIATLRW